MRTKSIITQKIILMRTLAEFREKKVTNDAFNVLNLYALSDVEMNFVRGGGDPPDDGEPIDVFFPYPPIP